MLDQVAESIRAAQTFNGIPPDRYLVSQLSLGKLLADRALQVPDKVFLTYYDDDLDDLGIGAKFTYAEFNDLVLRIANWLSRTLGIKAGDCVGLLSHNHPHAAAAQFACWRIGAVIAPQNVHEDDARIAFILADAGCKVLLYLPEFTGRAKAIAATMTGLESICELADPGVMVPSSQNGKGLDLTSDEDFRPLPALLVYTSGTTGNPKGVLLTQYNLLINALGTCQWHRIDETQRLMCVLPIHHVNGIVVTLVTPLVAGSSVVLNKAFKARTFWKRLAAERIAIVSTVPTILQFLCEANEDIGKLDLKAFRYPICGAGTLAISLAERFEKQFGFPVMHAYGLSETTAFVCSMPVDLSSGEHRKWIAAHGYPSIGTAFPHVEMAIHDDQGSTLGAGERGEIVVRGH